MIKHIPLLLSLFALNVFMIQLQPSQIDTTKILNIVAALTTIIISILASISIVGDKIKDLKEKFKRK